MSDILSTLFTIEVIACLVVAGSAAIGVSVVSGYSRDRVPLGKKLRKTERQLEKLRNHIAEKQGAIKQLQAEVEALQPPYDQLLAYHEDLLGIQSMLTCPSISWLGQSTPPDIRCMTPGGSTSYRLASSCETRVYPTTSLRLN